MPDRISSLDESVTTLYDVFASRSRRAEIEFDACDHCVSPAEASALARTPLRDLGADLLSTFILNAVSGTWGTADDLWYYLPRILELVATGGLGAFDLWNLFPAMGLRWRAWPPAQQEAVRGYLSALWQEAITGSASLATVSVLDVLEAVGELGLPAGSYLDVWQTCHEENAALSLAWLIRNLSRRDRAWFREISHWLSGPTPGLVLTRALRGASTPDVAATLSAALVAINSAGRLAP